MRHILILLLFLGSLLGAGPAAANAPEDWFTDEGEATLQSYASTVFPDLSEEDRAALTIGDPSPVIEATATDSRLGDQEPASYIAPVYSGDTAVGVIGHPADETGDTDALVIADAFLAEQLTKLGDSDILLHDPEMGGHYIVRGDEVFPASEEALDQLAGSTSLESFMELRSSMISDSVGTVEATPHRDTRPVVVTVAVLALFLLFTIVLTWLRRTPDTPTVHDPVHRHIRQARFYRRGGHRVHSDD
ncbi:hypothetical protein [Flaviflexus equikiangi]|uniref:Uncharacterized protein n=1 Tax=Flaviflexus equikiangi TaxID=2758573 RepID=A0ABS2THG9_9ACTO|nr:hypothetical protein [Flaviflexus equikiangi]MBM9433732.1 hypothetical protein [Flaviflexus equikiangi]